MLLEPGIGIWHHRPEFNHLEDYEIDQIDKDCKEFLKDEKEVKKIVRKTIRFDLKIIGLFVILTSIFYYVCFYITNEPTYNIYFTYFLLATIFLVVFWFFFISPLRTHQLRNKDNKLDVKLFLKYRGIITPGTSIKKQLSDNRRAFVIFGCFLTSLLIIFSVYEDYPVLYYLNGVYRSYTGVALNEIESTIPVLVVLMMAANVIGFIAIGSYDKKNKITDENLAKTHIKKIILLITLISFIAINLILAVSNARVASGFWGNANAVTTTDTAHFNAAWATFFLYFFIYLGIAAIGIMILLGLSALEGGYIKMLYRRKIENLPP